MNDLEKLRSLLLAKWLEVDTTYARDKLAFEQLEEAINAIKNGCKITYPTTATEWLVDLMNKNSPQYVEDLLLKLKNEYDL